MLNLLITEVAPAALSMNNTRPVMTNSGSLRFDIYPGPFTKYDQLTTSPFTNAFVHIPAVIANQAFIALSKAGERKRSMGELEEGDQEAYARGYIDIHFNQPPENLDRKNSGSEGDKLVT